MRCAAKATGNRADPFATEALFFWSMQHFFFGSFVNFFEIERVNCGNWRELGIKKIFDSISIVRKKCRNVDKDKDKDN